MSRAKKRRKDLEWRFEVDGDGKPLELRAPIRVQRRVRGRHVARWEGGRGRDVGMRSHVREMRWARKAEGITRR